MATTYPYTLLAQDFDSGDAQPASKGWPGGDGYLVIQGTIGSATVQLKFAGPKDVATDADDDNINEITPTQAIGSSIAVAGISTFSAPPGMLQAFMGGTLGAGLWIAAYPKPVKNL